ncbi:hypothetical protein L873DRAFT_1172726 [Choiromyces venosus 120613-1]|uniref:Uncharacterized protein n=1 Tax=Choiromyces venosus 120613-1 TaxID=1336337 RepID=A0A3N4K2K2_9PEZI|nr:hypothetical protein L873DRAFT_1172726 [Choiromyces venosus 120613-1]
MHGNIYTDLRLEPLLVIKRYPVLLLYSTRPFSIEFLPEKPSGREPLVNFMNNRYSFTKELSEHTSLPLPTLPYHSPPPGSPEHSQHIPPPQKTTSKSRQWWSLLEHSVTTGILTPTQNLIPGP